MRLTFLFSLIRLLSWGLCAGLLSLQLVLGETRAAEMESTSPGPLAGPVPAIVEGVVDGDTLRVRARIWLDQEVRVLVRVAGIDTPELRGRCAGENVLALKAREFTGNFLRQREKPDPAIWLTEIDQDKFGGRVLAQVRNTDGNDLAAALVRAGFARDYAGGRRADWCRETQADIRRDEPG